MSFELTTWWNYYKSSLSLAMFLITSTSLVLAMCFYWKYISFPCHALLWGVLYIPFPSHVLLLRVHLLSLPCVFIKSTSLILTMCFYLTYVSWPCHMLLLRVHLLPLPCSFIKSTFLILTTYCFNYE